MNMKFNKISGQDALTNSNAIFAASYEKVLESMHLGFFDIFHTGVSIIDKYGNFCYCNKAFLKIYGLPEKIVGRNIQEFFPVEVKNLESTLADHKMVLSFEDSSSQVSGILFNYGIYNEKHEFCGMAIESIPYNIARDKVEHLLNSMHTLDMKSYSLNICKKPQPSDLNTFEGMIGESPVMRNMRRLGKSFAASDEPVLITGESGVGKELVARALHNASPRAGQPFVSVNCAALPSELTESELFGYEAGSFTGARAGGMKGKFEQANGGTIFLDEIGELPLAIQAKLLRVLENGEVQKIGSSNSLHSNFRLIGATNRDLMQMIRLGKFREDIYHRLSVFELKVPPLRERGDDVFLLTQFYIRQYLACDADVWLDPEMETIFRNYTWPGNIRELKNTLIYALYALGAGQRTMEIKHMPQRLLSSLQKSASRPERKDEEVTALTEQPPLDEKQSLKSTLERLRFNKALTARELGISRSKLYRMLNKYGLNG